jgi:hypothetical protein
MSRRTERPSAAPHEDFAVAPARGQARRRVTMLTLALLVGGLGGFALYLLLEAL